MDKTAGGGSKRRSDQGLDVCPGTVYLIRRGDVRLSHLIVSGLLSLMYSFSINVVDLPFHQKIGQSNDILARWQNANVT